MTPQRWRQIREVFDRVCPLAGAARQTELERLSDGDDALRAEVESLLAAHRRASGFIEPPAADAVPERIGAYTPERPLGHGGMGTVYLATRADDAYHRQVAIKLLRRGLDTEELIRRFRSERQILATLEHPNITGLLDGGSTEDGRPYLVMEYVDGKAIDRYCDARALSVPDRVRLMRKVCDAVQFAHRNLIVHRDLKPSNILITAEGEPKLCDFGIAKLLSPEGFPLTVLPTEPGQLAMTPAYASPEQIEGRPVSTASDVYSLGIVLYELLAGRRPYSLDGLGGTALVRAVREARPAPPSTFATGPAARALRGDLDRVVMTALAADPERRYASAERLGQDLGHVLAGRPVSARADTWRYRARTFVRRHRAAVAATAGAFALLLALVATLLVQQRRLIDQRNVARGVSGFLVALLENADPTRSRGETVTVREVLDQAARDLDRRLGGAPRTRADLLDTLGRAYDGLGLYPQAEAALEAAVEARRATLGDDHPLLADSLQALAVVRAYQSAFDDAEALGRQALRIRERRFGPRHAATVTSRFRLAWLLERRGRYRQAATAFDRAVADARAAGDADLLATVLDRRAILASHLGDLDHAQALLDEALALRRAAHGELDEEVAMMTNNLALVHLARADFATAETLLQDVAATQRRLFGDRHPHLVATVNNLGRVAHERGDYDDAEAHYREALAMAGEVYGPRHPALATSLTNLADLDAQRDRVDDAERRHRQALEMRRALLGDDHSDVAASLNALALLEAGRGELEAAEARYREALAIARSSFDGAHPQTAAILTNLCQAARRRGHLDAAREACAEAVAQLRAVYGPRHPDLAVALNAFADVELAAGDLEAAGSGFADSLAILEHRLGADHLDVARARIKLANLALRRERFADAAALGGGALEVFRRQLPDSETWIAWAHYCLGLALDGLGDAAAAEHLRAALPAFARIYGPDDEGTARLSAALARWDGPPASAGSDGG